MRSNPDTLTIVDTGAGWPGNVWQIAMLCECIIIPTTLSWADLRPTIEFVREMDERKESLDTVAPHLIIVPNKIPPSQRDMSMLSDNVKDSETPEMIAHKYYGNVTYHWTILLVNDIIDYYEDWPMSVQRFEEFVKEKYDNPQAIHHYEITQTSGDTSVKIDVGMNTTEYPSAVAVSNYQYEDNLQEKKRSIRLIGSDKIEDFVKEFERKMNEAS